MENEIEILVYDVEPDESIFQDKRAIITKGIVWEFSIVSDSNEWDANGFKIITKDGLNDKCNNEHTDGAAS